MSDGNTNYIYFNSGLDMNSKYLTEPVAYFLGGIFASEEFVTNKYGSYRIAPVRHNYHKATLADLTMHYQSVKKMATPLNGQCYMVSNIKGTCWDNKKNLIGFNTYFKVSDSSFNLYALIPNLTIALKNSMQSVRRAFLVGAFDGRSSADIDQKTFKVRMLSLDCISSNVGQFLQTLLQSESIDFNYNQSRDRIAGGVRNDQIRIKDVETFMSDVGLISPTRFNILKNAYSNYHQVSIVPDLSLEDLKKMQLS